MNDEGQVMAGFYFDEEGFRAEHMNMRRHHKKLVAKMNQDYMFMD